MSYSQRKNEREEMYILYTIFYTSLEPIMTKINSYSSQLTTQHNTFYLILHLKYITFSPKYFSSIDGYIYICVLLLIM